ncbi:hypothetical protein TanjilG_32717 [Lupinus angustifolius]|uniref:MADS-box domain-containing protein n=1 Tax=Lupinus angustifolius TaxID=3871 RepID=A0A4P1RGA8_LUPAN|nr:PREDICTED: agamous-like MADS-box protein AGL103 [Lupinus angustifolius]OIW09977.1 hypothetical protein TanjilG_32717 [Lupinus angustifolius]
MGRGRIPMEVIKKEKARKTTFQKRKNGLMKKVYEFSTLCGVDVCLIIYAPDFDDQGDAEFETWPHDTREVHRIIQKYNNTTSDRRPRIYDVQEYFKDRMKKVEAEISKVHKEKHKIMYPTWDESFNGLGEEQLRMFVSSLDAKLNTCNQRINMLKGDIGKGKIAEPNKAGLVTPYLASKPSNHLNFLLNMPQGQFYPSPMKPISDNINNQLAFYPYQFGQISQTNMLHFGQNCLQLMGPNGMSDCVGGQFGGVTYDPKTAMLKDYEAENNENISPYYYNGNVHTMQPYNIMQSFPSQNSQYEAAFNTPPNLSPSQGFAPHTFYDTNMLQAHILNDMHGRK